MGGETKAAIAYGFKTDIFFNDRPGYYYCADADPGEAVYCGVFLKSTNLVEAMKEIKRVDASIIAKFDDFAKRFNETPSWQAVISGELELDLGFPESEYEDEEEK